MKIPKKKIENFFDEKDPEILQNNSKNKEKFIHWSLNLKTEQIDVVLFPNYVHQTNVIYCSWETGVATDLIGWHLW